MRVPSIESLRDVFDSDPRSVAEITTGSFLPLERWPEGEVLVSTAVAGRTLRVYLAPKIHCVRVEIDVPDTIVSLQIEGVVWVEATADAQASKGLRIGRREGASVEVRTSPDISLRSI